jgi:hypothetical protein
MKISKNNLIVALLKENMELKKEVEDLRDTVRRNREWLDKAKREAGAHPNNSFDNVWAEALAETKRAAELDKEVEFLNRICETYTDALHGHANIVVLDNDSAASTDRTKKARAARDEYIQYTIQQTLD